MTKLPPKHVKRANAYYVIERLGWEELKEKYKDAKNVPFGSEEAKKFYNA